MSNHWNQNNFNRDSSHVEETPLETAEDETTVEVPEPEQDTTQEVEAEEQTESNDEDTESDAETKGTKPKAGSKGISRAQVRRIAAKTVEVLDAEESTRTVVSALVGSSSDAVELTSSIMVAPRTAKAPLADIDELSALIKENEKFRAAINAGSLAPAQRKAMWTTLVAVGAGTGNLPTDTQKAVLELLEAITDLDAGATATLEAAAELLKRS